MAATGTPGHRGGLERSFGEEREPERRKVARRLFGPNGVALCRRAGLERAGEIDVARAVRRRHA